MSLQMAGFFEECANLRDAFFDIGTEDGIVPDFSEVVPVEIVLSCFIDNCDIPAICANLRIIILNLMWTRIPTKMMEIWLNSHGLEV